MESGRSSRRIVRSADIVELVVDACMAAPEVAAMRFEDGAEISRADVDRVRRRIDVVDPDWPLVSEAARIKAHGGLSYADAFCVATARRADAPLWTGDPEIVDQAAEHSCAVVDLRAPDG